MKVKYIGSSDAQVNLGNCDDPRNVLIEGEVYEVEEEDVHTWHTKLSLIGIDGKFNSTCFDRLEERNER